MYIDLIEDACTISAWFEHASEVRKIWSSHHQIGTRSIVIGIIQIPPSIQRCKDWFWAMATLSWNRGSPYTSAQSAADFWYGPCTSQLIIWFIWHQYQWFQYRSGGAVTGFLFPLSKIQSSHRQNCTGPIDMGINQILSSIRRCKDWFQVIKNVISK